MNWTVRFFMFYVAFYLWNLTSTSVSDSNRLVCYFAIYYLIVDPLGSGRTAKYMSDAIHSGEINSYLTKPINFPATQVFKIFAALTSRIIVPIFILIIGAIVRPDLFASASVGYFIMFVVFLILGFVIWNIFMLTIGSIAFWGTEVGFTLTVIDLVLNLFRGAWIPLYLFPESFRNILNLTPIPYIGAFPVTVFQGEISTEQIFSSLLINLFWITILFIIFRIVYSKGLKKFEAQGG